MRISRSATFFAIIAIFGPWASPALAATFCVGSESALQDALDTASINGENNTIKVRSGTYNAPSFGFNYSQNAGNFNLDLEGGWNAGCAAQTRKASLTVLDGQSIHEVLRFAASATGSSGNITLRYFDVYHGLDQNGYSPALDVLVYDGNVRVEGCRFRNNVSGSFPDVVSIEGHAGTIYFRGNVVADNSAPQNSALMSIFAAAAPGAVYINNNTIADNVFATTGPVYGTLFTYTVSLSNNILWSNGGPEIWGGANALMYNNDVDQIGATPAPGSVANISADPQFAGALDRHILSSSPARDAGTNTPAGGTLPVDLDGNPRTVSGQIDMGAYELQDDIFADGFDG
jgi:hypothetical protein